VSVRSRFVAMWAARVRHTAPRRRVGGLAIGLVALTVLQGGCDRPEGELSQRATTLTVFHRGNEREVFAPLRYSAQFLIFASLVKYDKQGDIGPALARGWEHSSDYREWTFHLRTDVRWHDGVPFTARDVRFTKDLFQKAWDVPNPVQVRVLDDSTFTLLSPDPLDALDWWEVVYPEHLLAGLDPAEFYEWEFWMHPVGVGPYRFARRLPHTMVELEANPDYYAGKPRIERVVLKFGEMPLNELLAGGVDVARVERADLPKLRDDPRFRAYDHLYPNMGWRNGIYWNQRDPLFRDPAVRRALTLAIDRPELRRVLNLPDNLPVVDVLFTGRQWRRGDLPEGLAYDPGRAAALLDGVGWRDADGNGLREREGIEFRFTALAPQTEQHDKAALYVQESLRRVGIRMEIQPTERSVVFARLHSGDYQAAFTRLDLGNRVDRAYFFGEGSRLGYVNAEVTRLIEAIPSAIDPETQDSIYRTLWPFLEEDLPAVFLYPGAWSIVADRRVRGLESPFHADPVMHMEQLWLTDGE